MIDNATTHAVVVLHRRVKNLSLFIYENFYLLNLYVAHLTTEVIFPARAHIFFLFSLSFFQLLYFSFPLFFPSFLTFYILFIFNLSFLSCHKMESCHEMAPKHPNIPEAVEVDA